MSLSVHYYAVHMLLVAAIISTASAQYIGTVYLPSTDGTPNTNYFGTGTKVRMPLKGVPSSRASSPRLTTHHNTLCAGHHRAGLHERQL